MQNKNNFPRKLGTSALLFSLFALLAACSGSDSSTVNGDVSVAYVARPTGSLGNPTDATMFTAGGDLYIREKSSPSAATINVTGSLTQGRGDVSDPEVSYDGTKLLFSMSPSATDSWGIWEYDITRKTLRGPIACTAATGTTPAGDDLDPAYLPDGRIVFSSNRQVKSQQVNGFAYLDEYEREPAAVLHVMNSDGTNCRQISFNQSHDRNPTVLTTGEIMYSRWDHVGERNQFSIFTTNPDGTGLFVLYGAHSPGNSYLHPREMPNGQLLSTLMPLSGTDEGGALMQIDVKNFSENNEPAVSGGSGSGQRQPTAQQINFGGGVSPYGRYSTPYPLWDGTNRVLVSWTPSQPQSATNPLTGSRETVEGTPVYGVYMLNLDDQTLRPVVTAPAGYSVLDPVAIQSRSLPNPIQDKALNATDASGALLATKPSQIGTTGVGILNVKSVYDTDGQGRMGNAVLVTPESIPMLGGVPDIARLKDPARSSAADRPARFIRITKAVPTQPGISMEAIGETEFEMQQILGYTEIEPDGSFKIEVPADVPIAITVVDKDGRGFTPHTSWIQVRPGETRTCNGCHSARRGEALNSGPLASLHPNTLMPGVANSGDSMAETRTGIDSTQLQLKSHMSFTDVWTNLSAPAVVAAGRTTLDPALTINYTGLTTPAPATAGADRGVIDYPTHIQPLWEKVRTGPLGEDHRCATCHAVNSSVLAARGLDLGNGLSGTGRLLSYDELLIGDPVLDGNGLPTFRVVDDELRLVRGEPQVNPGIARGSHLIEVLFGQELLSALVVATGQDHRNMLNPSELRLVSEWIDLGAQHYNSPRDVNNNNRLRGVTGLSQTVFNNTVQPILLTRCGTCHQAVGLPGTGGTTPNPGFTGRRFVLTGQPEGDFNVTLSMVGSVDTPTASPLLRRPTSDGVAPNPAHPMIPINSPTTSVLSSGEADYKAICNWIRAGACP